jgi:hypothetical protein
MTAAAESTNLVPCVARWQKGSVVRLKHGRRRNWHLPKTGAQLRRGIATKGCVQSGVCFAPSGQCRLQQRHTRWGDPDSAGSTVGLIRFDPHQPPPFKRFECSGQRCSVHSKE